MADTKLEVNTDGVAQGAEPASKLSAAEIQAQNAALGLVLIPQNITPLEAALQTEVRKTDQRLEQQLYSTVGGWAGVMAAIAKISSLSKESEQRKSAERMRDEMFALMAKEEKKKKFREGVFFRQLVSVLGESVAESITQKLESAGVTASGLQANKEGLAQASKDIANILERGAPHLKLSVGGEPLSQAIEAEMGQALAELSKPRPNLTLVRPEESLARETHEKMFSLKTGEERLLAIQSIRGSMGPEKFAAMLDAYDRKYGVPLVAHIASVSSSSMATQQQMLHEMRSVLNPSQQQRLETFGRAEFAQSLALLELKREEAVRSQRGIVGQMRDTEAHLARELKRPEIANAAAEVVREKLLAELASQFPQLKGLSLEGVAVRLKEVAGQADDKLAAQDLRFLLGGKPVGDEVEFRKMVTRLAVHTSELVALDQQLEATKLLLSKAENGDEALLRKHYTTVFGGAATQETPNLKSLTTRAQTHFRHLESRIQDLNLSSSERAQLMLERDSIEFAMVRKLVAGSLAGQGERPDAQRAMATLLSFINKNVESETRRSPTYLEAARGTFEAVSQAEALRKEWDGLTPTEFQDVKIEAILPTGERIRAISRPPPNVAQVPTGGHVSQVADALSRPNHFGSVANRKEAFTVLEAQREAALSTKWFAQIVEAGVVAEKGTVPRLSVGSDPHSQRMHARLERMAGSADTMDRANSTIRELSPVIDAQRLNSFVRQESLAAGEKELSTQTLSKLKASSTSEAIEAISRELDSKRDLVVDRAALDSLRAVVDPESEAGRSIAAVPRDLANTHQEYISIKSRLSFEDSLRVDRYLAQEVALNSAGQPSGGTKLWMSIATSSTQEIAGELPDALSRARLSRVERMLGALTDAEHEELLALFEANTRQSLGAAALKSVPFEPTATHEGAKNGGALNRRHTLLLEVAGRRFVTKGDLAPLFGARGIPEDQMERGEALKKILVKDAEEVRVPPEVPAKLVENSYRYATLQVAASTAASTGDLKLLSEVTEALRALDSETNGEIARAVQRFDGGYLNRHAVHTQLRLLVQNARDRHIPGLISDASIVTSTAKEAVSLLRPEAPKVDAAFNRVRQANLTDAETLLLRALYRQEAARRVLAAGNRELSGDLAKDLRPLGAVSNLEEKRIQALVRGDKEALLKADLAALEEVKRDLALRQERREKIELETLSNLRAVGAYDRAKGHIAADELSPSAKRYHESVVRKDSVGADATDLETKATNGDLKQQDVAKFAAGKTQADYERVNREYPELQAKIAKSDPKVVDSTTAAVISANEHDRRGAYEQTVLKALRDAHTFSYWLDVAGGDKEKVALLHRLEHIVRDLPDAPTESGKNSILVDYVRSQKTDFREIDASLINSMIAPLLRSGKSLDPDVLNQLRSLRSRASSQLESIDAMHNERFAVVAAARQIQNKFVATDIWASGDTVLKSLETGWWPSSEEARRVEAARAARVAELHKLDPMLADLNDRQLAKGQKGRRFEITSGHLLNDLVDTTKGCVQKQGRLLAGMEAGLQDIQQTRELTRRAFALMAEDAEARVFRGLTSEGTATSQTLLQQRDARVEYRVTDELMYDRFETVLSSTGEKLESRDRYLSIGLTATKVVACTAVSFVGTPAAGLAMAYGLACVFNVSESLVDGIKGGEDWSKVGKKFGITLGIDTALFIGGRWLLGWRVAGRTGEEGIKGVSNVKTFREAPWNWFKDGSTYKVVNDLIRRPVRWDTVTPSKAVNKFLADLGKEIQEKAGEEAVKKATAAGITEQVVLDQVRREASETASRWVVLEFARHAAPIAAPIAAAHGVTGKVAGAVSGETTAPQAPKLTDPAIVGAPISKRDSEDYHFVVQPQPAVPNPAPAPQPTPPQQPPPAPATPTPQNVEPPVSPPAEPTVTAAAGNEPKGNGSSSPTNPGEPVSPGAPGPGGAGAPPPAPPPAGPSNAGDPGTGAPGDGNAPGRAIPVASAPMASGDNNAGNGAGDKGTESPSAGALVTPANPLFGAPATPAQPSDPTPAVVVVQPNVVVQPPAVASAPLGDKVITPQAGLQPILDPNPFAVARPLGAAEPARNSEALPNTQATPQPTVIAQASASGVSNVATLDTNLTPMPRADIQSALMHSSTAMPEVVAQAQRQAAPEQPELVPSQQSKAQLAASKVALDDEFVFVVAKKDAVTMRRRHQEGKPNAESDSVAFAQSLTSKEARKESATAEADSPLASASSSAEEKRPVGTKDQNATTEAVVAKVANRSRIARAEETAVGSEAVREEKRLQSRSEVASQARKREDQATIASSQGVRTQEKSLSHIATDGDRRPQTNLAEGQREELRRSVSQSSDNDVAKITQSALRRGAVRADSPTVTQQAIEVTGVPNLQVSTPQSTSRVQTPDSEDSEEQASQTTTSTGSKRSARSRDAIKDARMRHLILQQLMSQHFNQVQREKLLKALIQLGISESEYRALVVKLGEMEAARLAQEQADRRKFAEPLAVQVETPVVMPVANTDTGPAKTDEKDFPKGSRARIYKELKEQKEGSAKGK